MGASASSGDGESWAGRYMRGEVDVEVFMGRGGTQFRWRYRAQHGLDQTPIPA